jgi:hypothetical protein
VTYLRACWVVNYYIKRKCVVWNNEQFGRLQRKDVEFEELFSRVRDLSSSVTVSFAKDFFGGISASFLLFKIQSENFTLFVYPFLIAKFGAASVIY